jgi:tRNA modification GTPase
MKEEVGTETIAAVATPPGRGGVGIVRVAGPRSLAVADAIFKCKPPCPSERSAHTFVYGHVYDGDGLVDEALLLIMRAPHSYTTEDMVEIQGHGGPVLIQRILRCALDAGARLAEPGEFTRRAFLNGRIDLLQAEAVADLVGARSARAAKAALEQLDGELSSKFNALYEKLLASTADVEATLDFPEEDVPKSVIRNLPGRIDDLQDGVTTLLRSWDEGHLLRHGALVVISGKPNVGKSTLLNALLKRDRAIVSQMPGTTRDTIEEVVVMDGIPVRLVDTAGLREVECAVEQEGIGRARSHIARADLHLYMVDASQPLLEEEVAFLESLPPDRVIPVLNKTDLGTVATLPVPYAERAVQTCLLAGEGVDAVRSVLQASLEHNVDMSEEVHAVIAERHRRLLLQAQEELAGARKLAVDEGEPATVWIGEHLRSALDALGQITGRSYSADVLDTIFSRFCIGK